MTQPDQTNDTGAQQPAGAQQPTAQQHQQKAQAWAAGLTKMAPASIRKPWVGALALCAALLLIVTLVFSGGDSPEDVATDFATALCKGEVDKVLELTHFPSPAQKEAMSGLMRQLMPELKKEVDDKGGLVRVEVLSSEIDRANPDRATVELRMHFKNGQEENTQKLIRVKGKWMVLAK
ncbi:MAG: DUF4878 domain-containing protein [Ottowia sp.]|nr:DUF4878 domain-containing protein [Ottowia sp.]